MLKKMKIAMLAVIILCTIGFPPMNVSAHPEVTVTEDFSVLPEEGYRSENWIVDSSNPQFFDSDDTRLVRTSTNTEYVVLHMDDIQSFELQAYYFSGSTGVVKFYGSPDAVSWSDIPNQSDNPAATDSGWYGIVYTPSEALPADTNYLKIELSGDIEAWMMQLGSILLSNISKAEQTLHDELADFSQMDSYSGNWTIADSDQEFFGGDSTRLVRTSVNEEYIIYHLHNIRNFSARLHSFSGSTGTMKFYGSSDASNWTELAAGHDHPESTGDLAWAGANYSPAEALPADIHYLKVELSGDSENWLMQLGSVMLSNVPPSGGGTGGLGDYYIDSVGGSDSNDGRTEATAWRTFANVNNTTFAAGDRILLKKGGIWNEQLFPKGSGTSEAPITISSYGSGNRPIINGGGMAGAAVYLRNSSYWVIKDLEVTNSAPERGNTYREGIMVENANGGTLSGIQILDNYVHDVSSSFRYPTVSGAEGGPHAFGGISVYVGGTMPTDKFDGVLIQGNMVERIGRTGIVVWDQRFNGTDYASTNVIIRENYVKQADSDGILTFGVDGGLIEHNVAEGGGNYSEPGEFNGSAAIWPTRGKNNVVQFNESFNTNKPEGDGQGFNLDIDSTDSIVQYNYSHDNKGGFMLFVDASLTPDVLVGSSNSVVRYNISQNDLTHTFNFAGGVTPGTQIYNNTIYIGTGQNTKIIDHEWDEAGNINAPYSFKNNLVYNLGQGSYNLPGVNGVFEHNLLYGNHPANEPEDPYKITANPLLVAQGTGAIGINSVDGYKLREGSPALGAGVVIDNNGGQDYWGNPVSAAEAPNIGAYNGPGLDPATLPEPPIDDLKLYYQGLNVVPYMADGSGLDKSLQLKFTNSSDTDELMITNITWSVGEGSSVLSGTDTNVPSVAPRSQSSYSIPLKGLEEGVKYPLELKIDIAGYEPVHMERDIDFNRILHQTDEQQPVMINLADGYNLITGYNGEHDLSGQVQLRWDSVNFYLTAAIQDDVFSYNSSDMNIWQNDSIQFSLAPGVPGDSQSWFEYGISQTPEGSQIYRWISMQGGATGLVSKGTLNVTRDETSKITLYELALPWSEVYPIRAAVNQTLSFSMLVNDNDGAGRKGYIEWGSGIGGAKDSSLFRTFQLMSPDHGTGLDSNADLTALSIDGVMLPDFDPKTLTYKFTVPYTKTKVSVTGITSDPRAAMKVSGGSNLDVGSNPITVTVTSSDGTVTKTYTVNVVREVSGGGTGGNGGGTGGNNSVGNNGGTNSGNNSGKNSGSNSGGNSSTANGPNRIEPGSIQIQAPSSADDADGMVHVNVPSEEMKAALEHSQDGSLMIQVLDTKGEARNTAVHIPADQLMNKVTSLGVRANGVTVSFPVDSLAGKLRADSKQLDLSIVRVESSQLPGSIADKLQGHPVYLIKLAVDGEEIDYINDNGASIMKVAIEYEPKPGEAPHQIVIYSSGDNGRLEVIQHAKYDSRTGVITFQTKGFGQYAVAYSGIRFSDLNPGSAAMIEALASREIVRGVGGDKFEPNRHIRRGEFAQLLASVMELPVLAKEEVSARTFKDVNPEHWYFQIVSSLQRLGVIQGRSDDTFGALDPVTREEMAAIVYRALDHIAYRPGQGNSEFTFKDEGQIADYSFEAVKGLQQAGIIHGYADGSFKPKGLTTRMEAATMIYNLTGLQF
ncbi:S-layer homology domain-containing protein [Paenibacillus lentus]|uniref:S-layer homology domain-containing protein n=1 Tax=Paenibacillus lentus TaxID=1338368 RepID=UPI00364F636D